MNNKVQQQKSKPHFHVLDGLRGMAALIILVFHYTEMIYPGDYVGNPLGHGFLAVDFFFCLSGFVVAYAYDDRLGKIGVKGFFINRLIRLHPLVVFGTIIGLIAYIWDPFLADPTSAGWLKITMGTIASVFMIPVVDLPYRFGCNLPLNAPAWSLFSEYFISIVYAFVIIRMGKKMITALLLISAVALFYVTFKEGWLSVGWDFRTFYGGFPRVIYSFTAGLAIYRFNLVIKNKGGFLLSCLILMGVFFFPHAQHDWIREPVLVIIVFPLIVALGAGAIAGSRMIKFCKLIGDLSYPIYMTHVVTIFLFYNYMVLHPDITMKEKVLISVVGILLNIVFAYFTMKLFDEPVRKWLTKIKLKRLAKKNTKQEVLA